MRFIHFDVMSESVMIVNSKYEFRLNMCINVEDIHALLPHSSILYTDQFLMLTLTLSCDRNAQLFPNGSVLILGNISKSKAWSMMSEVQQHLQQLYPNVQSEEMTMKYTVAPTQWKTSVSLLDRMYTILSFVCIHFFLIVSVLILWNLLINM